MTDRASASPPRSSGGSPAEPITDRLVSMFDPDARPIRKGKLGKPNEFGYVAQICEVTQNTRRGARGFILPPRSCSATRREQAATRHDQRAGPARVCDPARSHSTAASSRQTAEALAVLAPQRVFIAGRQQPGSRRTQRRLARYRVGAEGRISHLKRGYGIVDPDSRERTEPTPGTPGRSPPTTLTPSPSGPAETIHPLDQERTPFARTGRVNHGAAALVLSRLSGASS